MFNPLTNVHNIIRLKIQSIWHNNIMLYLLKLIKVLRYTILKVFKTTYIRLTIIYKLGKLIYKIIK